jgi:hypothetical protein
MNCCDEGTCRQGRDHPPKYNMCTLTLVVLMYWAAVMVIILLRP